MGDSVRQLRPTSYWCFVPGVKHGSGTGDHCMVASAVDKTTSLTPMGRFSKPFVTGPNPIPFFHAGDRDEDRKEVVAEPEREERMGPAVAIGGSRPGGGSSACGGDCCGEQRPLRGGTAGPRSRTSTPIRVFYGGLASSGGLVRVLWSEDGGHAVDRRLLDSALRDSGRAGFEVYLVNARHTKNLPGRKSDVQESQWLLKLHTYGLLNNSFQPPSEIRTLRTYWRQRAEHVRGAATCVQRMQKALTQMNLQLANVISDLSGVTGQKIVRAIVAGERDPQKLAAHSDPRIHASRDTIAKSLEGN
jgi:transposase